MSTSDHPCVTCGACCSYFQVSFDKSEVIEGTKPWTVPDYLAFEDGDGTLTMYGTDIPSRPRCIALKGKVGKFAICKNYENRPEVCRRFKASYSDGTHNPRCDEARMAHWLEPLSLSDWDKVAVS